ncbi:hypothetical protein KR093_008817 [Drosophila rubida]|uniref:Uncharacterized protein n=1 Tax=Drosophila rubida TaxID=30044 RepID=A0AAD4K1B1_9MUSC|nr:hypothetical protein KR093_008817 [Drosophila rubida]
MSSVCHLLLLLLLGGTLFLTAALDELEIDAQVAPPPVGKFSYNALHNKLLTLPRHSAAARPSLWHTFMGRVRHALKRWEPVARTTTTTHPRIQLRSTTESELQYYGALNPIYQMNNF